MSQKDEKYLATWWTTIKGTGTEDVTVLKAGISTNVIMSNITEPNLGSFYEVKFSSGLNDRWSPAFTQFCEIQGGLNYSVYTSFLVSMTAGVQPSPSSVKFKKHLINDVTLSNVNVTSPDTLLIMKILWEN